MPDWEWHMDWFGSDVVWGLVGAVLLCGLVVWWSWWVTRDLGKWF